MRPFLNNYETILIPLWSHLWTINNPW